MCVDVRQFNRTCAFFDEARCHKGYDADQPCVWGGGSCQAGGGCPLPPPQPPQPPAAPPPAPPPPGACLHTCASARDGLCDDGGPGSQYAICALGTDCVDCGYRALPP